MKMAGSRPPRLWRFKRPDRDPPRRSRSSGAAQSGQRIGSAVGFVVDPVAIAPSTSQAEYPALRRGQRRSRIHRTVERQPGVESAPTGPTRQQRIASISTLAADSFAGSPSPCVRSGAGCAAADHRKRRQDRRSADQERHRLHDSRRLQSGENLRRYPQQHDRPQPGSGSPLARRRHSRRSDDRLVRTPGVELYEAERGHGRLP